MTSRVNPNELTDPLTIAETHASTCELGLADRRNHTRDRAIERPVRLTLANNAFEATFLASYEDLVRIRDWTDRAIRAIDRNDGRNEDTIATTGANQEAA